MLRLFSLLLFGLVLSGIAGSGTAWAETINCKRTSNSSAGFTSSSAFDSWFPKQLSLNTFDWAKVSGQKSVKKKDGQRIYQLLPNGKMIASMEHRSGYQTVSNIRYKCDKTAIQIASGDTSGSTVVASNNDQYHDYYKCVNEKKVKLCSVSDLCSQAITTEYNSDGTQTKKWSSRGWAKSYVKEAKKRGVTCGVGEVSYQSDSTAQTTVASTRPNHLNPDRPEYYADMTDDYLCKTATGYPDHAPKGVYGKSWSPHKPKYKAEAIRRGLSCGLAVANQDTSTDTEIATLDSNSLRRASRYADKIRYRSPSLRKRMALTIVSMSDREICGVSSGSGAHEIAQEEIKHRGVNCWKLRASNELATNGNSDAVKQMSSSEICKNATFTQHNSKIWKSETGQEGVFVKEAKMRGLTCGIVSSNDTLLASNDDERICTNAVSQLAGASPQWFTDQQSQKWVNEAKRRGLSCGVVAGNTAVKAKMSIYPDEIVCTNATSQVTGSPAVWFTDSPSQKWVQEAKRRGLSCGVGEASANRAVASDVPPDVERLITMLGYRDNSRTRGLIKNILTKNDADICAVSPQSYYYGVVASEVRRRGLNCDIDEVAASQNKSTTSHSDRVRGMSDRGVCYNATWKRDNLVTWSRFESYVREAKRRGLNCGVTETSSKQIASSNTTQPNTPTSAELEAERQKRIKLEQQLAALKAQQEQQQKTISNDTNLPTITIASTTTTGAQGIIRGRVNDNTGIAELRVDGQKIAVDSNGNFSATTYVPEGGTSVNIEAIDLAGLSSTMSVRLDRATTQTASISFDRLNPLKRKALPNKDAVALIIGIGTYENIIDAAYADKDALVFRDYATEKLGIPDNQIKTLINEDAEIGEVLLGIRKWIRRSTKPDKTDVYVFYAGHGIATATGEAYILPYDGRPEVDLLDRTALLQKELFAEIDKAKPRNVTIFLDACYTGKARTGEVLMADANYRPIAIRPIDDGMPDNFTLITASSGDEFSGPLEEAKHGLFSYFLMKGMEGDADSNQDKKITAGELHQFVKENVLRQSADKQTPELQGNADRVLVTFK